MGNSFNSAHAESGELCFASLELEHQLFAVSTNSNNDKQSNSNTDIQNGHCYFGNEFHIDLLREIVGFLNVIEYVCGILLVCKTWNTLNIHWFQFNQLNTANRKLLDRIIYNTRKKHLIIDQCNQRIDYDAIIYNFWISASHADFHSYYSIISQNNHQEILRLYDEMCIAGMVGYNLGVAHWKLTITPIRQRDAHHYFLCFIQKCHFGGRDKLSMDKLFVYLKRVIFFGGALCFGLMLEILFEKYSIKYNPNMYKTKFCFDAYFWKQLLHLFSFFYHNHQLTNNDSEQLWKKKQIMSDFLRICEKFIRLNEEYGNGYITQRYLVKVWKNWIVTSSSNPLQSMLTNK